MKRTLGLVLSMLIMARPGFGEPLPLDKVPPVLRPWIPWALHGHEEARCPFFAGNEEARLCFWPSRLEIQIDERGGHFTQQWLTAKKGTVSLPGDSTRWPLDVQINGKPAVVIDHNGGPVVEVPPGVHRISGLFRWDALPDSLHIPQETGLLSLSIGGKSISFPERDTGGQLWLRRQLHGQDEQERLEIVVHRKVVDEIPLELHTHIILYVAGKNREVLLGRALWNELVPMELKSQLPARVEPDGRLRVQVRPGKWIVELKARHDRPLNMLKLPSPDGPWAPEEVWVFEAKNHLRLVWIKGVAAIDPQQTTLPNEWKVLPAYRIRSGETFELEERRRGDSDPPPDRLSLDRTLWLDFDGGGFTIADRISGTLRRSWRLEAQQALKLGHIAANGQDQFITVRDRGGLAGVEIRQGRLDIKADSRYEGNISSIPAVGWNQDFYQVSGRLHLPPGWQLFHASGVDDVSEIWIKKWSLLDLFVMLLISLAVGKLFGWPWSALALFTLALNLPEEDAPYWIWTIVLAIEALWRVLPDGWIKRMTRLARGVAVIVLVVTALSFMVQQVRHGMYPVLENPHQSLESSASSVRDEAPSWLSRNVASAPAAPASGEPAPLVQVQDEDARGKEDAEQAAVQSDQSSAPSDGVLVKKLRAKHKGEEGKLGSRQRYALAGPSGSSAKGGFQQQQLNLLQHDPTAMVQTGPGVQSWHWREVSLKWSGPVQRDQPLVLTLLPPWMNLFLAILRTLALTVLVVVVTRLSSLKLSRVGRAAALSVLLLFITGPARAQMPSEELLGQLKDRLLQKPECVPHCIASDHLRIEGRDASLRLLLEIHSAAWTALPLPGQAKQWLPEKVLLDGKPAGGLALRDERIWLFVNPGKHKVELEGPLPDSETVQIPLPLKPHWVEAHIEGWRLEGLHEDGLADDNLQLTRIHKKGQSASSALQPGVLPPFALVTRHLMLGLSWQVETTITRQTPLGTAMVLEVPLLPGESITTTDIRVVHGKALVNMGPEVSSASWHSVLKEAGEILLQAPADVSWSEAWQLEVGPIWHVELSGFPPVHPQDEEQRLPLFRPWPGEKLVLKVSRPHGVPGQTLTIDSSLLTVEPGLRATDFTLRLRLRSSRGTQHTVTLPEHAQLQSVSINETPQPVRQEGRRVTLPLVPGEHLVKLVWRLNEGLSTRFVVPTCDVGERTVNASTTITMPGNRWILFAGGPRAGPAVLFWSLLSILLVVSLGLGRLSLTPLRTHQWLLLAIGLSQVPLWAAAIVPGWFILMGWRQRSPDWGKKFWFDLRQLAIVGWTLVAVAVLFSAIHQGLLGEPEMQISGNGSTMGVLRWFVDRSGKELPRPWAISVPLFVYRLAMLTWALWLAWALIQWLRWIWRSFSEGGMWRRLRSVARAENVAKENPTKEASSKDNPDNESSTD